MIGAPTEGLDLIRELGAQRTVEDRVVHELRELIVSGKLAGGTRLTHRQLAGRLGVSPTPIRVALNRLQHEGLVAIQPNGRAMVSHLSSEEFEELCVARVALEGLAARLGAEAIPPAAVEQMGDLLAELTRAARARAIALFLRARWEFYSVCYRSSRRERLVSEVERLYWRAERYNHLAFSGASRFVESLEFHERFLRTCEKNDGIEAERIIQEAIRWSVDYLMPVLASENDPMHGSKKRPR